MTNNSIFNKNFRRKELKNLELFFDKLWPLNRSLTGNEVRRTHRILKEIIPLKTYEFKSLSKAHDWKIPLEWNVKRAFIENLKGKKIIDFKKNNLHLIGYSRPFSGILKKEILKKKIHFIRSMPNAIPYRTNYYKNDWGFCISYKQFLKLKDKNYKVVIDSKLTKGSLTISDYLIPGKSKKEILIHTYTCHPSMANNELSGPLVTAFLAKRIKNNYFSYRFIFAPETIGAIVYLNKFGKYLKKHLVAGYICTCVGIDNFVTYKRSKSYDSFADKFAINVIKKEKKIRTKILNFKPSGSDERQFCSIGYNLPVGSIMSKPYGKYKEYHTSLDSKKIINFRHMQKILDIYSKVFDSIEKNKDQILDKNLLQKLNNKKKSYDKIKKNTIYPLNLKIYGEPRISKYNIHYGLKNHSKADILTMATKWLIHYSNGENSLEKISKLSRIDKNVLKKSLKSLCKAKIFKIVKKK